MARMAGPVNRRYKHRMEPLVYGPADTRAIVEASRADYRREFGSWAT